MQQWGSCKKLNAIIINKRTYLHGYRLSEYEAALTLIPILTNQPQVRHIKSYQGKENLILPKQLNSIANKLADTYPADPKQFNIPSTPVAIHFDGQYITNDYQYKLRNISHFNQAKQSISDKYNWIEKTFNDIESNIHHRRIRKKGDTVYRKLRFIYYFLPSDKMNFDSNDQCKHFGELYSKRTPSWSLPTMRENAFIGKWPTFINHQHPYHNA